MAVYAASPRVFHSTRPYTWSKRDACKRPAVPSSPARRSGDTTLRRVMFFSREMNSRGRRFKSSATGIYDIAPVIYRAEVKPYKRVNTSGNTLRGPPPAPPGAPGRGGRRD